MPKITIPVTITLDLPAAAEWADIFERCGQREAAAGDDHHDHRASICEEADTDASSRDRASASGGQPVRFHAESEEASAEAGHTSVISRMVRSTSWSTCSAPKGSRSKPTRTTAAAIVL